MNPLEAAATELAMALGHTFKAVGPDAPKPGPNTLRITTEVLQAFVRAAVGCPQCNGTGDGPIDHVYTDVSNHLVVESSPCPAEHVELTILGATIWADPEKCEWRHGSASSLGVTRKQACPGTLRQCSPLCGWQPRIDALFGEDQ